MVLNKNIGPFHLLVPISKYLYDKAKIRTWVKAIDQPFSFLTTMTFSL